MRSASRGLEVESAHDLRRGDLSPVRASAVGGPAYHGGEQKERLRLDCVESLAPIGRRRASGGGSVTAEEVRSIANGTRGVDGGCPYCWAEVLAVLASVAPEHEQVIESAWVAAGYGPGGWKEND